MQRYRRPAAGVKAGPRNNSVSVVEATVSVATVFRVPEMTPRGMLFTYAEVRICPGVVGELTVISYLLSGAEGNVTVGVGFHFAGKSRSVCRYLAHWVLSVGASVVIAQSEAVSSASRRSLMRSMSHSSGAVVSCSANKFMLPRM